MNIASTRRWMCIGLLLSPAIVMGSNSGQQSVIYSGVVTTVSEGSLYLGGFSHSIATVKTEQGPKRVAISTMGVMQPLQVGESISFSGPTITINSESVINTKDGFMFRPAEKSMAEYMADMQAKAQAQIKEMTKGGTPNAVPTMLLESPQQAEENTAKRRTDLLLTVMSIILALLAFERMQHLMATPIRWVKSKFKSKTHV